MRDMWEEFYHELVQECNDLIERNKELEHANRHLRDEFCASCCHKGAPQGRHSHAARLPSDDS
jgi:hypothetical protein